MQVPRGQGLYHRCKAVLKRVLGNKGRTAMTLPELRWPGWSATAALSFLYLLDGIARYV